MNEERFLIQFIPAKHCFLQFSNKWFQKLNSPKCACVKLTHPVTKEELRFSCTPQPSFGLNDCSVGINATFAQSLNLHENDLVVLSSEESLTPLQQVFLTPVSSDDYDILEMSREMVELSLLNQIRAVYVKQILVVWVSKTMHLKLSVDNLIPPLTHGRLEQMTELVIESVTESSSRNKVYPSNSSIPSTNIPKPPSYQQPHENKSDQSIWNIVSDYLPEKILDLFTPVTKTHEETVEEIDNASLVCRVHPLPLQQESTKCCDSIHDERIHPYNVFLFENVLKSVKFWSVNTFIQKLVESDSQAVVCRLESVPKNTSKQNGIKTVEHPRSVIVRLYKIAETCSVFTRTNVSCVFLAKSLRHLLSLETGAKVVLTAYSAPLDQLLLEVKLLLPEKLDESEERKLIEKFSERLPTRNGVLVNNHCPLVVPMSDSTERTVLVELSPAQLECWPLTVPELQVCSLTVMLEPSCSLGVGSGIQEPQQSISIRPCIFEDYVKEGVAALECGLGLKKDKNKDIFLDNILITGKKGSGKSTLAEAIYSSVSGPPHFVHVSILQCEPLKGKKPESIGKILAERVEECMYFQPSVLVLEDLPSIAGTATNDLEPGQEAQYWLRLAVVLKELLYLVPTSQYVSLIATAESRSHVHPQLCSTRGRHTFTTFLHIPPLNREFRQRILTSLFEKRMTDFSHLDVEELARKTEGSVAQDLNKLVDRVVFKSCQRNLQAQSGSGLDVRECDVEAALSGFVPSQLANVSLKRNNNLTFHSVGGLDQAKQLLTEVLIWPTKYPEIFSQCPLKLERGVLLYGAPGTGKTLLANAAVGESGLNLITVKGPELLSKYIGASEEAVRNVFHKAQSAAPCILFFDEFDSLAPRRGHDSTGVTDRVVNQLLTQMDGVEALEGVWVLAAASRPDLLDPALLRPGRIGTLVHCTLPHQTERLSILQKLSANLRLADDVELDVIAARTEGFTGADLQAVLFTAQMNAFETLHQDLDDLEESNMNIENVCVGQEDLLSALQNTSPSLKPGDSARFQSIYESFQKSRSSTSTQSSQDESLRVTLA